MISFTVKGHPKISGEHRSTLEFTKDDHIVGNGDCILGISSDHDIRDLNKLNGKLIFLMKIGGIEDSFEATIPKNHKISDEKELVIRTSSFVSSRTYAIGSSKASLDIDRNIIKALRDGKEMKVTVYEKTKSIQ
jgi:hypothetical protein